MARVLSAFSLATDLGTGQPMGTVVRACYIGARIADELALPASAQAEIYYTCLLSHAGCTAGAGDFATLIDGDEIAATHHLLLLEATPVDLLRWLARNVAPLAPLHVRAQRILGMLAGGVGGIEERARGVCEVGARIAHRLGMPPGVEEGLRQLFESWNGRGVNGLKSEQIPLCSRVACAAVVLALAHSVSGPAGTEETARRKAGKSLDPQVVEAFLSAAHAPGFWDELAQDDLSERVLDLEPDVPYRDVTEARLDDIALSLADFADLKLGRSLHHARDVAGLAERVARRMGLPAPEVTTIRRAALLHDLGLVALPFLLLDKPRQRLSPAERQRFQLHPYYSEHILSHIPALQPVAVLAGAHHERMDGQGYYRAVPAHQTPLGARIVAVVDYFDEAASGGSDGAPVEPRDVLRLMQPEVGPNLDPDCFEALRRELGDAPRAQRPPRREWPAGLTDREVEVLRLIAQGLTKRQIGERLFISEKTAGTHVEHLYGKAGVSSRAAAVLFAIEHGLLR